MRKLGIPPCIRDGGAGGPDFWALRQRSLGQGLQLSWGWERAEGAGSQALFSVYSTWCLLSFLGWRWSRWPSPGQAGPLPRFITRAATGASHSPAVPAQELRRGLGGVSAWPAERQEWLLPSPRACKGEETPSRGSEHHRPRSQARCWVGFRREGSLVQRAASPPKGAGQLVQDLRSGQGS